MVETKAEREALVEEIREWKKKRNALILAHNYELPEVAGRRGLRRRLARSLARAACGRMPT